MNRHLLTTYIFWHFNISGSYIPDVTTKLFLLNVMFPPVNQPGTGSIQFNPVTTGYVQSAFIMADICSCAIIKSYCYGESSRPTSDE